MRKFAKIVHNLRSILFHAKHYNGFPLVNCCSVHSNSSDSEKRQYRDGDTHFGFETVKESEKAQKVHKVFETVANKYDLMNDVMSMGIHRLWKDILMHRLSPNENTKLLDVAGGTGDIAFRFINYVNTLKATNGSHVTVLDINKHMLKVGEDRCGRLGYNPKLISWIEGDAENLPFPDNTFNAYTIAFGIRNITHGDKVVNV